MRLKKIVLPVSVIAIILIVLPFIIVPFYNNWCLDKFATQLLSHTLPAQTILLKDIKQCGNLSGNGNGIDFLVVLLIRSELDQKDIELYYDNLSLIEARSDKNSLSEPPIIRTHSLQSNELNLSYLNSSISIGDIQDFSNTYAVILFDGGYNADFDLRGH